MPTLKLTDEMVLVLTRFQHDTLHQKPGKAHSALLEIGVRAGNELLLHLSAMNDELYRERGGNDYFNADSVWDQEKAEKGVAQIKQLFDVAEAVKTVALYLKELSSNETASLDIYSTAETQLQIGTGENAPRPMEPEDFAMHWWEPKLTDEMFLVLSHFSSDTFHSRQGNALRAFHVAGVKTVSPEMRQLCTLNAEIYRERGGNDYYNDIPEWDQSIAEKGIAQIKNLIVVAEAVRSIAQCLKVISPNDPSSLLIHSTAETILRIETEENDPENMDPEEFAMLWFQSTQGQSEEET